MRTSLIIILLAVAFCATAQRNKPVTYYYTAASERYFTDGEMDTLFFESAAAVFEDNGIPRSQFESKYPKFKTTLIAATRKDIVQSFKWVESTGSSTIKATKGSADYEENKALYKDNLEKNINAAFRNNKTLRSYFRQNNNDRITFFKSTVRIHPDGKLTVKEEISIYNGNGTAQNTYDFDPTTTGQTLNNEIKRGIVRTFPLYYVNENHLFQNTTFKVKEVLRNGVPESYHTEKEKNGILLYTGSSSVFINNGYHHYSITYETEHQLKFLKDFDELYWNVTGTGWSFKIDSAMCTIILPKGANSLSSRCYTGSQGEADVNCNFKTSTDGENTIVVFKTTRSLQPRQGITIATSWPKGFVTQPTSMQKMGYYIWNNKAVFFLPIAALFSFIFCFFFWLKYGKDKKRGSIYPEYTPPAGFSPAALGYIYAQKFTNQLTGATIVDAAVRNVIRIDVEKEGWLMKRNVYDIRTSAKPKKPTVSAYNSFESDVKDLIGTTIQKGKYNKSLGDLNKEVKNFCESNYKNKDGIETNKHKGFFATNNTYTSIPIILCMIAAGWGFFGGIYPIVQTGNLWQLGYLVAGLILCIVIIKVFSKLLPSYSIKGRQLMDKIEGFRIFLSTADAKRFDAMAPPEKTLELYERYLPFAIALDCEIQWGEQFESIIATAMLDPETASSFGTTFSLDSHNSIGSSAFVSSFSGAISSASTPPSSSSGGGSSFGGGFNGGGGGGGGGGGW